MSPDRLMSSVLDWVAASAPHYGFDSEKIIARGISTGGYSAFRVARTHVDQLFAAVAQGGGCHPMSDTAWIGAQDQMEYPFALAEAPLLIPVDRQGGRGQTVIGNISHGVVMVRGGTAGCVLASSGGARPRTGPSSLCRPRAASVHPASPT